MKSLFLILLFLINMQFCICVELEDIDTNNEEIQQYFNTNYCEYNKSKVCQTIKDFLFSLSVLEKIQEHNLILAYNNESTKSAKRKSDIRYQDNKLKELKDGGKQVLNYHNVQSKEIVMVTKEEYIQLRNSMLRFCKNFASLNKSDKEILFSLTWHNHEIFSDENFIKKFCSSKF